MAIPRNELKFYFPTDYSTLLLSRLSATMQMDTHTQKSGKYRIRSLYFDDPSFSAYHDKLNGLENRAKYRLRFYNSDLSYIRLEKKEKKGKLCFKHVEPILHADAERLLLPNPGNTESLLFNELSHKVHFSRFRPLLFVDYDRSAFLHPVGNVRITVDRNVAASRFDVHLSDDLLPIPVLDAGMSVLEIKYDSVFPPYLSSLLEDIPKLSASVSKFCLCAQALF